MARHYRHPAQVHHAVMTGATWQQIADATGGDAGQALEGYLRWAEGQHKLRGDFPGGTIGMGDEEYAAAVKAAAAADQGGHEVPRHDPAAQLAEVRAVLAAFDWEFDDRQYALEKIERIVTGGEGQEDEAEDDHWRDYNYACSTCGARIGVFIGRDGWQHYRGEGTVASPVEIYDAGHEAALAERLGGTS